MKRSLSARAERALPLLLSFLLPFFLSFAVFAFIGAYPFGDGTILAHDGWHQYYPFLLNLRDKLLHGGSLQYTWNVGMGSSYLSLFAYYLASPLNLLSVLCPSESMPEFFTLLTILKLSFAGLFMAYFLKTAFGKNDFSLAVFGLAYALCSYAGGYYWNIMWLDVFALLPLLIAATLRLLRDGAFKLYVITLALTLWSNYYIAYACCIFVVLFFFAYCIACPGSFLRRFARIALCTLLGAGLAAVLLIPTLLAMGNTYSSNNKMPNALSLYIAKGATGVAAGGSFFQTLLHQTLPGLWEALKKTVPNLVSFKSATSFNESLPNLFCTYSAVMLALFYLCCGKIRLRERLASLGLLLILLLSFFFRRVDYVWHGFHVPNMLPYRYSFLFSFVLIAMAYRAYQLMDAFRPAYFALILPLALELRFAAYAEKCGTTVYLVSGCVFVGMILFFLLYSPKKLRKRAAQLLALLLIVAETTLCFAFTAQKVAVTTRSTYPRDGAAVRALLATTDTSDGGRVETTTTQTFNDGALNGYRGITVFNSSANVSFNRLTHAMGLSSWPGSNRYAYYESSPFTNVLCGLKYLLDRDDQHPETTGLTQIASAGRSVLYRNDYYLSLGFMTDAAFGDYVSPDEEKNSIKMQEEMFRAATGVEAPLYDHLTRSEVSAGEGGTIRPTGYSGTQYSYSTKDATGKVTFTIDYEIPRDGLAVLSTRYPHNDCKEVTVYRNDEKIFTRNIRIPELLSLGDCKAGDKLTLSYTIPSGVADRAIIADVALMNDEVFTEGYATLADEVWNVTYSADTELRGTINVRNDGLFYTSVPYEPGWTATVDGKEVALAEGYSAKEKNVAVKNAVVCFPLTAGHHEIVLTYRAPGLTLGMVISGVSLLAFVALCILLRKRGVLLPAPERLTELPADEEATTAEENAPPADASDAADEDTADGLPLSFEPLLREELPLAPEAETGAAMDSEAPAEAERGTDDEAFTEAENMTDGEAPSEPKIADETEPATASSPVPDAAPPASTNEV